MTTETAPATAEKMLTTRDLRRMYWRSTFLLGSFNFERMQAMGFCYTLMPAIRKFYRDDKSAQAAALKRHLEFYNTHHPGPDRADDDCEDGDGMGDMFRFEKTAGTIAAGCAGAVGA